MSSMIVKIAEAVRAELNVAVAASQFSQPFKATRHYAVDNDLEDLKGLHVLVVPKAVDQAGASRSLVQNDYQIDVAVQRKLTTDPEDLAEVDGLMALTEEIANFFRLRRLDDPPAAWVRNENEPVYSQEHIRQLRVFTSVVTMTFRVLS